MKRKQLKVLGLSYSQSQIGSYILVLSEKKGNMKLPIIIKPTDAQNISVKIDNLKTNRPMTHDLFKALGDSYDIDILEVFIYSLAEGVFYSKIILSNGLDETEIECSIGDAVALSLTFKCPIWVSNDIIESVGFEMNDDGSETNDDNDYDLESDDDYEQPKSSNSINDLEHLMENAIANEEYEIAAELRDRITELKG